MKIISRLAALALSLAAGGCSHGQAPFDPIADCPRLEVCGQCASRGACAWCGDPSDGGQGQCVAVGHSECGAPKAWSQTPDRCPLPPVNGAVVASTSSAPSASSHASDTDRVAAVKAALQRAFPSAHVTDGLAAEAAALIPHAPRPGMTGGTETPRYEKAPIVKHVEEKDHHLYLGFATHHRVKGMPPEARAMQSKFTVPLPMVRVSLPDHVDAGHPTIETEIGDVDLSRDHLLGSIDLIQSKYGAAQYLGYRPARVDLITPARGLGSRFGAIAVYLGYRNKADRGPSFYLLEAGTASGDAKMIYFSPDMKPIANVTSYYLPTPFVSMRNTYSGGVAMGVAADEDEPKELVVSSYAEGAKEPYITVTVAYRRERSFDLPVPVELLVDAGARVSLIAKTMGIPNAEELESVLAGLAHTFAWQETPHYTSPAAAPSAPPAK